MQPSQLRIATSRGMPNSSAASMKAPGVTYLTAGQHNQHTAGQHVPHTPPQGTAAHPGRPAHSRCAAAYRTSCSDDTAGVLQLGTVHTCGRHTEQLPHGGAAAVLAHCLLKETDCLLKTHCRPAHLKSPHTFKLSWLPFSMYTAPPCLRACLSRSLNRRTMPVQKEQEAAGRQHMCCGYMQVLPAVHQQLQTLGRAASGLRSDPSKGLMAL